MRDRVKRGILISQENLETQLSRSGYRVNSRRSAQPDLWTPSKLTEFRARKNPEEKSNRSGQDVSRDHKESRKTRPCRISRSDRAWLRELPSKPCKTYRAHSQIRSTGWIRVRTPQNTC